MPYGALIGAAIAAGGTAASSAIQTSGNKKTQRESRQYNTQQWIRENMYNHPIAQRKRLEAAGLNPNLIYGSSTGTAAGNASPIPKGEASEYVFDNPLKDINQFADLKKTGVQTDNVEQQTNVMQQDAILKTAQTAETVAKTAKTTAETHKTKELRDMSLDAAKENLRTMEQNTIGKELDNSFKDQTLKNRVRQLYYESKNAQSNLKGSQLLNQLRVLEVELKKVGIERNDPWYFRIIGRNLELAKKTLNSTVKFKN